MRAMQAGFSSCRYGNKTQCDGMLWSTSDTTDPLVIYSVMQGFMSPLDLALMTALLSLVVLLFIHPSCRGVGA